MAIMVSEAKLRFLLTQLYIMGEEAGRNENNEEPTEYTSPDHAIEKCIESCKYSEFGKKDALPEKRT